MNPSLICSMRGIARSIKHGSVIEGHDFIEIYRNTDLSILVCECCGYQHIGWFIDPPTIKSIKNGWENADMCKAPPDYE